MLYQVDPEARQAMEQWRPVITINDDRHRPVSQYLFEGLSETSHYEVEISAENYLGKSAVTRFVFVTSEGLSLFTIPDRHVFCLICLLFSVNYPL